jgi:hypothetical protein
VTDPDPSGRLLAARLFVALRIARAGPVACATHDVWSMPRVAPLTHLVPQPGGRLWVELHFSEPLTAAGLDHVTFPLPSAAA